MVVRWTPNPSCTSPTWQQLRALLVQLDAHAGRYDRVVRDGLALIEEGLDRRRRDVVEVSLAVALIDLGRFDEAVPRIEQLLVDGDDVRGRGLGLWLLGEAELWGGRPRAALQAVDRFFARDDAGNFEPFGRVVEAWARYELGLPGKRWRAPALTPIVAGIPFEVEGLRLLGSGSPLDAAILLRRGAAAFAGGHARGEMRCRLGEALALSEAEARQHARELFLALAEQARVAEEHRRHLLRVSAALWLTLFSRGLDVRAIRLILRADLQIRMLHRAACNCCGACRGSWG